VFLPRENGDLGGLRQHFLEHFHTSSFSLIRQGFTLLQPPRARKLFRLLLDSIDGVVLRKSEVGPSAGVVAEVLVPERRLEFTSAPVAGPPGIQMRVRTAGFVADHPVDSCQLARGTAQDCFHFHTSRFLRSACAARMEAPGGCSRSVRPCERTAGGGCDFLKGERDSSGALGRDASRSAWDGASSRFSFRWGPLRFSGFKEPLVRLHY